MTYIFDKKHVTLEHYRNMLNLSNRTCCYSSVLIKDPILNMLLDVVLIKKKECISISSYIMQRRIDT